MLQQSWIGALGLSGIIFFPETVSFNTFSARKQVTTWKVTKRSLRFLIRLQVLSAHREQGSRSSLQKAKNKVLPLLLRQRKKSQVD